MLEQGFDVKGQPEIIKIPPSIINEPTTTIFCDKEENPVIDAGKPDSGGRTRAGQGDQLSKIKGAFGANAIILQRGGEFNFII